MKRLLFIAGFLIITTGLFAQVTELPNGNVGIGTSLPQEKLHINGSIRGNSTGGALRVKTSSGNLDLGAQNTSWAHIYTDRPKIIFNRDVYTVTNAFSSYNNDLILKTKGTERLRIDDVSGNIGIGTTAPGSFKLAVEGHVNIGGSKNYRLRTRHIDGKDYDSDQVDHLHLNYDIAKNVYVGYGSNKPKSNLLVYGYIRNGAADFQLGTHDGRDQGTKTGNRALVHNTGDRLHLNYAGDFEGGTYIDGAKTIFTSGIVGIGTTNPNTNYKLSVNGKIRAKEIKVEANWADYVFEDTYKLPTLLEVENHIEQKGHLINIPSAAEVEKNGIALGEMNAKLLEKIEELTLYTIAQEKKLQKMKTLEARLAKIEVLLNKSLN